MSFILHYFPWKNVNTTATSDSRVFPTFTQTPVPSLKIICGTMYVTCFSIGLSLSLWTVRLV